MNENGFHADVRYEFRGFQILAADQFYLIYTAPPPCDEQQP